jgi:hypothetical protein
MRKLRTKGLSDNYHSLPHLSYTFVSSSVPHRRVIEFICSTTVKKKKECNSDVLRNQTI